MPDAVTENPVLNSPYEEPRRHFRFEDQRITSDIQDERHSSSYFVPAPASRRSGGQLAHGAEWPLDRIDEKEFVNRERKLFFFQVEAAETAVFLTEFSSRSVHDWVESQLRTTQASGTTPSPVPSSRWRRVPIIPC